MQTDVRPTKTLGADLHQRALRVLAPCIYGSPFGRSGNPIMPIGTPSFFARAKGARMWDADGNEYIDFLCGLGTNLFGYGDPRIEEAAARQRELGDTMTGPAPVMVDLAEKMVEMISHADWAMFAKNGVDAISIALRIARAQTKRKRVLVATGSYHGAHSWCAPVKAGILPEERAHRVEYRYNDVGSLEAAVSEAGDDLAAIFATAFRHDHFVAQEMPNVEYAKRCREICDQKGALLVVDDIRAGFRITRDCSWEIVGVRPDLSCWSKAIANGYPLSALVGSQRTREGAAKVLATGTYWVQAVPMAAALATLSIIQNTNYLEHTIELGELFRSGLDERAAAHGFELTQTGPVQMPMLHFKGDKDFGLAMAFASQMIQRGIYLVPHHNLFICDAMTVEDVRQTIDSADAVFADLRSRRRTITPHPAIMEFFQQVS